MASEEPPVRTTHTTVRHQDDEDSQMRIPGFTIDKSEPDFTPIFTRKSDGPQYYGDYMMNVGFMGPLAVSARYPATHPVTWFLKNAILAPILVFWLFTMFFPLAFPGLCLSILGQSWNSMRGRK